jgi:hypothetical protein
MLLGEGGGGRVFGSGILHVRTCYPLEHLEPVPIYCEPDTKPQEQEILLFSLLYNMQWKSVGVRRLGSACFVVADFIHECDMFVFQLLY